MSKKTLLTAGGAAIVVIVVLVAWNMRSTSQTAPVADQTKTTSTTTPTEGNTTTPPNTPPTQPSKPSTVKKAKATDSITLGKRYEDALKAYYYKFQFTNCDTQTTSLTLKSNVPFLLANRDGESHTFMVGPTSYGIAAYDFVVVKIAKIGTYPVKCDGVTKAELRVQQ